MATGTRSTRSKAQAEKKFAFEYYAPEAEHVGIAASFNGWDASETPLKKEKDGKWKTSVTLKPGRYEYRFFVDGNWHNDPNPTECVPNPFGTWNCVVEIR